MQFIAAHFSIQDIPSLEADAPFTFSDAIFMFAFSLEFICCRSCGWWFPGAGWLPVWGECWWVHVDG
jgi:hypothetical protein